MRVTKYRKFNHTQTTTLTELEKQIRDEYRQNFFKMFEEMEQKILQLEWEIYKLKN